ncbi:MAG TPA: hypothetical protein VK833_06275 [Gillisia sp.]|nr:hypothetical protein [Gillisia sp.]
MKNKLLLPLFLFTSFLSFSQGLTTEGETTSSEEVYKRDIAKNELSIGAFNLVAFGALDIAYERIMTPNSSWAVEAFVLALNNDDIGDPYEKDLSLTGKYKYFFGDRSAWGFYVNGLAMISSGKYTNSDDLYVYDPNNDLVREEKKYTDFALGFGLGGKFVSKQGFFLDLSTGIGRNLFSEDSPTIVGQFNVNLGFRF